MKFGLKDNQIKEIVDKIQKFPEIEKAVIYGSRARGDFKPSSDVDIAIFGEKTNWALSASLQDELEEETYLPYFFDVVSYNTITSNDLKAEINKYGKILYDNKLKASNSKDT